MGLAVVAEAVANGTMQFLQAHFGAGYRHYVCEDGRDYLVLLFDEVREEPAQIEAYSALYALDEGV